MAGIGGIGRLLRHREGRRERRVEGLVCNARRGHGRP